MIFQSAHPLVALRYKDGPPRSVSWGGMSFEPDEKGNNWLPVEAVRELTESHGMEGVPGLPVVEARRPAPVVNPTTLGLSPLAPEMAQGGAIRPTVFPPDGEHPDGGPQPALGPPPREAEVLASASRPEAADKPSKK